MSGKNNPQSVIDAYKRRQKMMPKIVGGLAILLVVIGIVILIVWLSGSDRPKLVLFPSATPTETSTATPTPVTPTLTPSQTPTPTETGTPTLTPTRSGVIEYTVQEDDNCWIISEKYEVDLLVLLAANNFNPDECPIRPGDVIKIPAPGQELPTATPLPTNLPRGTKIEYTVLSGETLEIIAGKFNSTVDAIMTENDIEDANTISAGQKLTIPVNLVTPTPTRPASITPTGTITQATITPTP